MSMRPVRLDERGVLHHGGRDSRDALVVCPMMSYRNRTVSTVNCGTDCAWFHIEGPTNPVAMCKDHVIGMVARDDEEEEKSCCTI